MKTPEFWINLWSQSGAFDLIDTTAEAAELIEAIQKDALSSLLPQTTDQEELEMAKAIAENERIRADQLEEKLQWMKERWHESRRYLRAANKGAERNALALQLAMVRVHEMGRRSDITIEKRAWEWLSLADDGLRLRMGELTAQEIRTCRAMLRAILGTHELAKQKP